MLSLAIRECLHYWSYRFLQPLGTLPPVDYKKYSLKSLTPNCGLFVLFLFVICFFLVCYLFLLSASFIHSPHSHTIVLCYRIHWNLHPLQEYLLSNLNHMYYIIIYLPCTLWSRRILYRQCILPNPITFIEISSVVLFFRSFFPQISILVYHF